MHAKLPYASAKPFSIPPLVVTLSGVAFSPLTASLPLRLLEFVQSLPARACCLRRRCGVINWTRRDRALVCESGAVQDTAPARSIDLHGLILVSERAGDASGTCLPELARHGLSPAFCRIYGYHTRYAPSRVLPRAGSRRLKLEVSCSCLCTPEVHAVRYLA